MLLCIFDALVSHDISLLANHALRKRYFPDTNHKILLPLKSVECLGIEESSYLNHGAHKWYHTYIFNLHLCWLQRYSARSINPHTFSCMLSISHILVLFLLTSILAVIRMRSRRKAVRNVRGPPRPIPSAGFAISVAAPHYH